MRKHTRRGFTLFQLIVLLAFLVILLGLLFGAVRQARLVEARVSSVNNLKLLGIAAHSYHDATGRFPAAADSKGFSALAQMLPYVEQDELFKRIDFSKTPGDKDNAGPRATRVKAFESPDDKAGPADEKAGPTSYLLVSGSKAAIEDNDGVFPDGTKRFADVFDGLSNTLFAVETLRGDGGTKAESVARQHVRLKKDDLKGLKDEAGVKDFKDGKNIAGDRGGAWIEGKFLQTIVSLNRLANDERPDVDCGGAGGLAGPRTPGKAVNALLGDGSVRAINVKIKANLWTALATRGGGEVINPTDLE